MPRDPWKRAYDRRRLERGGGDPARDQPAVRWVSPRSVALAVALLALVATGVTAAWLYRATWLPRVREELPPSVAEHVPVPRVAVDFGALEQGVGHGLVLLGDYLDLISGTRELEPEWQVTQTGPDTLRLESDGIKVYVEDGLIRTYTLELPEFFASDRWREWHGDWREAGIMPELSWQALTGEEQQATGKTEHLYISPESVKLDEGWLRRAFNLEFRDGSLRRLEGRLEFGPSDNGAGAG